MSVVAGWVERISLPDWGVYGLAAKLDTGARTSAIHVEHLEEIDPDTIAFDVMLDRADPHHHVHVVTKWARRTVIRSSNGVPQSRYVVKTTLKMGPIEREIEISLVSRRNMRRRMLIGRTALTDVLVDSTRTYRLD